jgi:hypothetical protein
MNSALNSRDIFFPHEAPAEQWERGVDHAIKAPPVTTLAANSPHSSGSHHRIACFVAVASNSLDFDDESVCLPAPLMRCEKRDTAT